MVWPYDGSLAHGKVSLQFLFSSSVEGVLRSDRR